MDAKDWDARYARRAQRWSRGPTERVVREFGGLAPARALDIGCGEGRNAIWLASKGWQVRAVDFSALAIERGKERAAKLGLSIDWMVADATTLSLPERFDLVMVVFLHTPAAERARWMECARDAVRNGGTFFYLGHDASNLEHGHGGPRSSDVLCTPDDIVHALPGFRIETATVVERSASAEPGHRSVSKDAVARDALVRAIRVK